MVLIIFATLMILGIAFYQVVHGCFSAIIMAIVTVLCAAVAFNYYEPLADLLADRLGDYAHGTALLAMFVLPLLVLRILFDRFIRGNVVMGMWPDRIGGAAFGLISGMVLTGMFMIIFQLLPMPASMITYQPYDSSLADKDGGPPRWAANFTLAITRRLSVGSLRPVMGGREFGLTHDDLLLEAFCLRNRPPGARASTPTDALEVVGAYVVKVPDKDRLKQLTPVERDQLKAEISKIQDSDSTPSYPLLSWREREDAKVLVVRVKVDQSARNDKDNWFRLPASHFRLVCKSGRSFYPVGYLTYVVGWQVNTAVSEESRTQVGDIIVARPWQQKGGPAKLLVDWLYRIPAEETCDYMVFRRTAKAVVPAVINGLPTAVDERGARLALAVKAAIGKTKFSPPGAGLRLFQGESAEISDRLPERTRLRFVDSARPASIKQIEYTSSQLRIGLIEGPVDELVCSEVTGATYITRLLTPRENYFLLHVRCSVNRAFRVGSDIQNLLPRMRPMLLLDDGMSVSHRGAYFFYNRGPKRYLDFYYDADRPKGRIDGDFARRFLANVAGAESLGFIFAVPTDAGRSIVALTFLDKNDPKYTAYLFGASAPLACGTPR